MFLSTASSLELASLILSLYNCRASELLSLSKKNRLHNGNYVIKAKKGSTDIIITDRQLCELIDTHAERTNDLIFQHLSYAQLFHYIDKHYSHLFSSFKTTKNRKITHGFRYLNCSTVADSSTRSAILHHSNKRNQKYYYPVPKEG